MEEGAAMKRREFSRLTKQLCYGRSKGFCEHCKLPFKGIEYHHILEAEFGGDGSYNNCLVVCIPCHKYLTKTYSAPSIAKSNRIRNGRIGIKRKKKKLGYRLFDGTPMRPQ